MEYYDQPFPIELRYLSKTGRSVRVMHTPDFFVLKKTTAGWEECKTEQELQQKCLDSPHRFQQPEPRQWHCPPGEQYASNLGLYYAIRSDAKLNPTFRRNFVWLEDYWRNENLIVDQTLIADVHALVETQPGISLAQIAQQIQEASIDDLHVLIATNQVYIDEWH